MTGPIKPPEPTFAPLKEAKFPADRDLTSDPGAAPEILAPVNERRRKVAERWQQTAQGSVKVDGDPALSPVGKQIAFSKDHAVRFIAEAHNAMKANNAAVTEATADAERKLAALEPAVPRGDVTVLELARCAHLLNMSPADRSKKISTAQFGDDLELANILARVPHELWGGSADRRAGIQKRLEGAAWERRDEDTKRLVRHAAALERQVARDNRRYDAMIEEVRRIACNETLSKYGMGRQTRAQFKSVAEKVAFIRANGERAFTSLPAQ